MTTESVKTLRDNVAMRWLMLLLISGLMFAVFYFQDFYAGLKDLMENEFGFTSEQFGRVIGLTAIANMLGMVIIGGIVVDKYGIRIAGYVFGGLALIGGIVSSLTATGVIFENNTLLGLIIGRILFGAGLEAICVAVMRTVVKWFKGYELALAMGLNIGFGRLGSALAIAISLDIAGGTVAPAIIFATTLIGVAMIMFMVYTFFDYKLDSQNARIAGTKASDESSDSSDEFSLADVVALFKNSSFIYITLLCVAFYAAVFPFIQYAPDMLVNKFGFTYVLPDAGTIVLFGSEAMGNASVYLIIFVFALGVTLIPNNIKNKTNKIFVRAIIIFSFLVLLMLNLDLISVWLKNGPKTAALIPLGTILFTPVFGSLVDRKGKAASLMMLGAFLLIFAHLSIALFNQPFFAYMGLISLGIAFALVPASMWPSVAKIVPEKRIGSAYALMFTFQNYGLGVFFWGIGALLTIIPANRATQAEMDSVRNSLMVTEAVTTEHIVNRLEEIVVDLDITKESDYLFVAELRQSIQATGDLTGGEISDLIKIMQANELIKYYDYRIPILLLVLCGVISIFLAYKLKLADRRQGFGLELPSSAS